MAHNVMKLCLVAKNTRPTLNLSLNPPFLKTAVTSSMAI